MLRSSGWNASTSRTRGEPARSAGRHASGAVGMGLMRVPFVDEGALHRQRSRSPVRPDGPLHDQ
jgi:hypothetical protein